MWQGRNCGSNWGCYYFLIKKDCYKTLSNVTYSPSHRQAGDPMTNNQSTTRTAPDLGKNISLTILFGSNGNSYITSTQLEICTYAHLLHGTETLIGGEKKVGQQWMLCAKDISSRATSGMPTIVSSALL